MDSIWMRSSSRGADRIERVRDHLEALERFRDVYPLSGFVRRFRELTRIEWFCTSEERAEFDRLERFVEAYDSDGVVQSLSTDFVDARSRRRFGAAGTIEPAGAGPPTAST